MPYDLGMRGALSMLGLLLLGCGEPRMPAPPPPAWDGAVTTPLRLRLIDEIEGRLRLRSDESVELRFLLDDPSREEPIEGASIACATNGTDGGSSAPSAITDGSGEATVLLKTSDRPAYFGLKCSAARSNLVELGAAVSPSFEFHDASVSAVYTGDRILRGLRAMLVAGSTCDGALGSEPSATLTGSSEETLRFESVPAELSFAILLELMDSKNRSAARGCVDGLVADGGIYSIALEDLPFSAVGEYHAQLELRWPELSEGFARAGATAVYDLLGPDDISFLYGHFLSSLSEIDRIQFTPPLGSDYQIALRGDFERNEVGPSYIVDVLQSITESSAGGLRLEGRLNIEGNAPSYPIRFRTDAIRAGPAQGALSAVRLSDFAGNPDGIGVATEFGDPFYLDADLIFAFSRSAMVLAGARTAIGQASFSDLSRLFGCDVFADFPYFEVLIDCDENCLYSICHGALEAVIDAYTAGIGNAGGVETLELGFGLELDTAGAFPERLHVDALVARFGAGSTVPSATLTFD